MIVEFIEDSYESAYITVGAWLEQKGLDESDVEIKCDIETGLFSPNKWHIRVTYFEEMSLFYFVDSLQRGIIRLTAPADAKYRAEKTVDGHKYTLYGVWDGCA